MKKPFGTSFISFHKLLIIVLSVLFMANAYVGSYSMILLL